MDKVKGINLAIRDLKEQLVKIINASGIPISVIVMILTEILEQAKIVETQQVERERTEYEQNDETKKEGEQ